MVASLRYLDAFVKTDGRVAVLGATVVRGLGGRAPIVIGATVVVQLNRPTSAWNAAFRRPLHNGRN